MKKIPIHLAIIPDGNRRWAKAKGLPTFEGHRKGFAAISKVAEKARELGVKVLTVWAFSTENWNRSKEEVSYLMKIYEEWIRRNINKAVKDKVRFVHIGRTDRVPKALKQVIEEAEKKTTGFKESFLVLALDYGGKDEIIRAVKKIRNSKFEIRNEQELESFLDTKNIPHPNPDLIIRTGGEMRTSGFMIWQAVYAELIFVSKYLPDFTPEDLEDCFKEYARRQRRFGK